MKISTVIIFLTTLQLTANTYSQSIKVNVKNGSLSDVFQSIESQTDYTIFYKDNHVNSNMPINLKITGSNIEKVLDLALDGSNIKYSIIDNIIVLLKDPTSQEVTVKGKVTDIEGESLPGVNIIEKGTTNGAVTDLNGEYTISVSSPDAVLSFSYIGYLTEEVELGGKTTIDLTMIADIQSLEEVVVVGYGTMKKSDLTGSIATVGSEEFKDQPVNRVDQILQGRTAGVNVISSSGAPGGDTYIRIRGANSINGNNDPLYVIDGFVGADFRDINPTDIESIQILKDASSTAIYGSRGANGVVLITTKSGKSGAQKFSFTTRFSTSQILKKWDLMDAATFAETANERATALGTGLPFTDTEITNFRTNGGTDWQDELLRTGNGMEYQLDYSGGNEKVTYFVSGNYLDQDGIVINSDYKRYSLRTNIDARINDFLKANLKMSFARRENNNTSGDGNTSGAIAGALAWAPTVPVYTNGQFTVRDPISSVKSNPVEIANDDNIWEYNVLNTNGGFIVNLMEDLTLDIGFGVSYGNTQRKNASLGLISDNPSNMRESREKIFLQNTNILTYSKVLNGIHRITATGVVEHQLLQNDRFTINTGRLQFPGLGYDNITLGDGTSDADKTKQTIRSYIARLNYSLKDRYMITASIRTDGSSKFRGDNQYSTFPSAGLAWRISEEPFIQNMGFFDNLKLRASWGETGSQAIDVYGTITRFNTSDADAGTSFNNGELTSGIIIGNPGNPNLLWETTKQINVGLDFAILSNRLGVELDYFKKNTTDLLLSEPLPQYAGGGSIFRNLGETENTGFEISLNANVINTGDFNWYTTFNASFLTNEVVNIGDRERIPKDGDAGAGLTNLSEMVIVPGHSLSNYWGLKYLGTWKSSEVTEAAVYGNVPGDSKYEDLNDDGVIGGDDYQIIGTGIPTQLFGWNNTLNYKDFTLNVFFQSMRGFDKWNFSYALGVTAVADAREVTHVDIKDRWSPQNEGSDIPAFSSTDVTEIQSSRFIEKGDYIRLKNVSLTYNLPKNLIKAIDASVTISGMNLLTITDYTGIDPESYSNRGPSDSRGADAGSYPNAKTWTIGLNLIF